MTMSVKHILFDLDGTLLPMNQEQFVSFYMPLLAKAYIARGIQLGPKEFIGKVWQGYKAMVKNDGSRTNREAFWSHMEDALPISVKEAEEIALDFYGNGFNEAMKATMPTEIADKVVKSAKKKGYSVYLATNPVFPQCATFNRIRWAGLQKEDFEAITTYEDNRYCKPDVRYFKELLDRYELNPKECLMVGNDVGEDLVVRELGVQTYLVTDTMENPMNLAIETDYQGTMEELLKFVEEL